MNRLFRMDPSAELLEVIGGPLDGEIIRLPRDATEYIAVRPSGRGTDRYRTEEWTKRDAAGRAMWTRVCLVWVESPE